ncbi:MAG: VOC family protein [Candidatus Poribacteria bacterium]|nr:VOC family protein [Candidatus Poribacteria bacterium]MDE0314402.1 VOC family protein [Candidatus Poribacteria bacterium]MDE0637043.1 VOC family protein [Candidatus Poribacteria bacterium]
MGNPVMFFEIAGKNGEELCEFYSSIFDWEVSPETNNVHMCNTGSEEGIQGIIFPTTDDMPSTNHVTFYISVEDLEASVAKVESNGGKIIIPPTEIPGGMGSFAWFADPGGNLIGLHKQ